MKSTKTAPGNACWYCGHELTGATDMTGDHVPKAGSISICIECAQPGIFMADLSTRQPTTTEMEEILSSPQAQAYMLLVRAMKESKRG